MTTHFFCSFRSFLPALFVLATVLFSLSSCTSKQSENASTEASITNTSEYAVGFDIIQEGEFKTISFYRHYADISDTLRYVLHKSGQSVPESFSGYKKVKVPALRIALLQSSYLSYFDVCDAETAIKAISEARYIYDSAMYINIQNGLVPEVGYGDGLDKEAILALDIDLVVTVGWPNAPNKEQEFLESLGIPLIVFAEWQEYHPLGRAEWVKVVGTLTGNEEQAANYFQHVANEYNRLANLVSHADNKPTVLCNLPYKGSWYVPGGRSYMSNLLKDAGATYLWADNTATGGIQMDLETVYSKGIDADFWINPDFAQSLADVTDKDERVEDFKALKEGRVYNSIGRLARGEANDYWESALVNPQFVLADMISIFHPEALPVHSLYYYRKIE